MKITSIADNYRKRAFEIVVGNRTFDFPYDQLRLQPTSENRVVLAQPDPELGREAFTYQLESGEEDTVHVDAVLEVNRDPEYLQELLLHKLTIEAKAALKEQHLGVRAAARRLGTSPTQVYRLLDPNQSKKSLGQLMALLGMADREVEVIVRDRHVHQPTEFEVFRDTVGCYRFALRTEGERLVQARNAYKTRAACLSAIRSMRNSVKHENLIESRKTPHGAYKVFVLAKNHRILAESPTLASEGASDRLVAELRRHVPTASVDA